MSEQKTKTTYKTDSECCCQHDWRWTRDGELEPCGYGDACYIAVTASRDGRDIARMEETRDDQTIYYRIDADDNDVEVNYDKMTDAEQDMYDAMALQVGAVQVWSARWRKQCEIPAHAEREHAALIEWLSDYAFCGRMPRGFGNEHEVYAFRTTEARDAWREEQDEDYDDYTPEEVVAVLEQGDAITDNVSSLRYME